MKECGGRREEGGGKRKEGSGRREGGRIEEREGRMEEGRNFRGPGGPKEAEALPQYFQSSRGSAPYLEMGFTPLS